MVIPQRMENISAKFTTHCCCPCGDFFFSRHPCVASGFWQGGGAGGSSGRSAAKTTAMMASPLPDTPNTPPKEEQRPALVYGESATRSFVKALAWRLTAGVVTLVRRG